MIDFPTKEECIKSGNEFLEYMDGGSWTDEGKEIRAKRVFFYRLVQLNANLRRHFLSSITPYIVEETKKEDDIWHIFSEKYFEQTKNILEEKGFKIIKTDDYVSIG